MAVHSVKADIRPDAASAPVVWSRRRARGQVTLGPLQHLVSFQVRRAHVAVAQNFQAALSANDLSLMQYAVLSVIGENAGLSQTDLGNALGIDRSTMVAVIDRLQGRGLVFRESSPQDRRSYALKLTTDGKALLRSAAPLVDAYEAEIAGDLSDEERAELLSLLNRLGGVDPQ